MELNYTIPNVVEVEAIDDPTPTRAQILSDLEGFGNWIIMIPCLIKNISSWIIQILEKVFKLQDSGRQFERITTKILESFKK